MAVSMRIVDSTRQMGQSRTAFRVANESDTSRIVDLIESAYRGEISCKGWTTEAHFLDGQRTDIQEISELVHDSSARLILAQSGNELLGCVLVRDEVNYAHIGMLAIRPDYQARGLGRQLLEEAERCARSKFSAIKARMTVIVQRIELISWYERRGYCKTGEREPFPYGNPRFGLPRRPDLEFIVLAKSLLDL